MSENTNTERLRALAQQLVGLLDANEVGLHTWHEAVYAKIDEIAEFSSYRPAVRDAHTLLNGIPLADAVEWVRKAERLGLVERAAIHVEVPVRIEVLKTRPSTEPFILPPSTRLPNE